jgi:subtilase family serine protease
MHEERRSMRSALALCIGAVTAVLIICAAPASSATTPTVQAVCSSGPLRCLALLRTDIPAVPAAQAAHDGYGPADLRSAYNLANVSTKKGSGQTVGIVDAYDDPNAEADLAVYRSYYGLPPCTTANGCFRKVNQDGEQGNFPLANPDWELEISLDLDMVSAICPKCHIVLVEANSADETAAVGTPATHSDLGAAVDTAVNLGATEVSNSYGTVGPESNFTAWDHYYNHPGVAVTASSGDSDYGVIWPASSPFVTAVGGTTLDKASNARGWSETVWGSLGPGFPSEAQGAGSGCSVWEPKPAWQHDAGCTGRTVADVSAVADPNTGVAVYDSGVLGGGWNVVGGTSASSPIIASVYALAGNAAKVNYGSYPYSHTKSFFDVTSGSNFTPNTVCGYLCTGGPGYDGPTGWGTPNGTGGF